MENIAHQNNGDLDMTYKELPIIQVELDQLLLDLENYRIPTRREDETAALKYLFASEDVIGAARMILRDGYFDNEVPITIAASTQDETSSYIVLEGNRRVSALKTLHNPTLIPDYENEVRLLLKRYALEAENLPRRIRVLVAPDRTTAAPHVARLHTGVSKKRWSLDQQATFYYSLLNEQTTVDDIKAHYPDVNVVRFMKMAVMRRFLTGVPFSDTDLRQYATGNELKMSVFEYAYSKDEIAVVIGVKFDKDGMLLPRSLSPEKIGSELPKNRLYALEYLISEFRANKLNTRSLEFKKQSETYQTFVKYLREKFIDSSSILSPIIQSNIIAQSESTHNGEIKSHPVSFTATSGNIKLNQSKASSEMKRRGPNHPDTKNTLDLSGLDYEKTPYNLKLRYYELKKININNFPISAVILMRSVLESTIKNHFEGSDTPVSGELSKIFKQVTQSYSSNKSLKSNIDSIQSGKACKYGSIKWFNLITHSADASVEPEDVRAAWKLVNPLLRHLLRPAA